MKKISALLLFVGCLLGSSIGGVRVTACTPWPAEDDFEIDKFQNWHQWRGPLADGSAPKANPPVHWDNHTNIKWKTEIPGEGTSTPIVWRNRVFVLSAISTGRQAENPPVKDERSLTVPPTHYFQFTVWCVDLNSGDIIWKQVAVEAVPHEGHHPTHTYGAGSPMTDGKQLIVSFGSFGIFSYSLDGNLQWSRDLGDMRTRRGWGEATSPVIVDDRVVVNWDQEDDSHIFVLDAKSGETVWQADRDEPTTWATPLVVRRDGQQAQVITNGTNKIRSYDLATGNLNWQQAGTTLNAIPCPVLFKDHVICMAGYQGNRAVSLTLDSDGTAVNWELNRDTPYVPSPLLSGHRLYFTKSNMAVLNCVDAQSGKKIFGPTRLEGLENMYASPIAADGRIYISSREGATIVLREGDDFEVLATNRLDDTIDASPVAVGSKLLLRGRNHLYCIE